VALFSEIRLNPHVRFNIPNYDIYQTDREDVYKGGNAIAVKKGIPHTCRLTSSPFSRSNRGLHTDQKH
jgi:hypothetical protein